MCVIDVGRQRGSNLVYRQSQTNVGDTNSSGIYHPGKGKELASNFLDHQSIEPVNVGNLHDDNWYPEQSSKSSIIAYPR